MLFPTSPGSVFAHGGHNFIIPSSTPGITASGGAWREAQMGREELVTRLVLGNPQYRAFPGERMFRKIRQRTMSFTYFVHGTEHLRHFDTERAARARIGRVDFRFEERKGKLTRYSIATMRDADELALARAAVPSLRVREKCSALARRTVQLDIEARRAALITDPNSYPASNRITLAPGNEFNAPGGDTFTVIDLICRAIMQGTALQKDDLTVFMGNSAFAAAQQDPVLLAKRTNRTELLPSLEDLQRYWDVGNVWKGEALIERNGVIQPLYGDVCVVYYAGDDADFDTTYGDLTWAVEWRRNGGLSASPFYDPDHTSYVFPWHDYAHNDIVTPGSGGVIYNCSATE